MKPTSPSWAVERRVFPHAEEERMVAALSNRGLEHYEFVGRMFEDDPNLSSAAVPRGSCYFVRELSRSPHWLKELFGLPEQFDCRSYYPVFSSHLVNADHRLISFGELCWTQPELARQMGDSEGRLFIRPDDGFKTFEGTIVAPPDFPAWMQRQQLLQVGNAVKVAVARPVVLFSEWRVLMVGGRAVAASQYRPVKRAGTPEEVLRFAEKVHEEVGWLLGAYSLDIAQTADGLKIVEVGSLLCVAYYEAEPDAVIASLQPLVERALAGF